MEYRVIRSDRRSMALEITAEGELLVRSPRRATDREIDGFVLAHTAWIEKHLPAVLARRRPPLTAEAERALRDRARADLPARTALWAKRMGIEYTDVAITSARHRFGSCSSKGKICSSFRLMEFPEAVIDYVVVHELAHRRQMNHSRRFYEIVERYLPDYRDRVALMRTFPRSL